MYRIGFSKDIHKLVKGRKLLLCGVLIPYEYGLLGHSDADAPLHALSEAILSSLALGDLGTYYPATAQYQDYDSKLILKEVYEKALQKGYKINNLGVNINCEEPRLAPYIEEMRKTIAKILSLDLDQVSVTAGTNEEMGPVGKRKAIQAEAFVLLEKQ